MTNGRWVSSGPWTNRWYPAPAISRPHGTARGTGPRGWNSLAELLVSEVVTNAVEHGSSGGIVEIEALPAGLRVAVTDHAHGDPEVRHPSPDEPTGRGLAIVDQLSRWWGVEPVDGGKRVWFEVDDVDVTNRW